jgi:hypothetical protein
MRRFLSASGWAEACAEADNATTVASSAASTIARLRDVKRAFLPMRMQANP